MFTLADAIKAYADAIKAYADAPNKAVETLTDAEKRQAFLNAILDGQRVKPFATWCDIVQKTK